MPSAPATMFTILSSASVSMATECVSKYASIFIAKSITERTAIRFCIRKFWELGCIGDKDKGAGMIWIYTFINLNFYYIRNLIKRLQAVWNSKIEKQKHKGWRIAVKSPQWSEAKRGLATHSRNKADFKQIFIAPKLMISNFQFMIY